MSKSIDHGLEWLDLACSSARSTISNAHSAALRLGHASADGAVPDDGRRDALLDRLYRIASEARDIEADLAALHTERREGVAAR